MTRPDTILLVDDTRSDALLYSALLRAAKPPRTVEHAPTLEAALAMLETGGYSAVLLDLGLPDSEGLEGLERITARHPDLAVVVLTGREDDGLGERAIAAGAQEYLLKSEARPDILERVIRHAEARQALENNAREAAAELHVLFDRNPMPVFVFEVESLRMRAANAAALEFYGWTHEEFLRLTALDIRPEREHHLFLSTLRDKPERFLGVEWTHMNRDGRLLTVKVNNEPIRFQGHDCRMVIVRDLSRERAAESARRRGDRRLATLADALPLLLMFLDRKLRVEFINSGWTRELRRPAGEILGQPVLELIREPAACHFAEGLEIARAGVEHTVEFDDPDETAIRTWAATFIPQHDHAGGVDGIHVMLRDVTLDKAYRQDLARRAEQDPLTGVLNRAGFQRYGAQAWAETARQGRRLGVFYFDLDDFKEINDSLGHAAGDGLLQEVAARVGECVRADDLVARLGGDEFAVIARHVSRPDAARRMADKLIAAVGAASLQHGPGDAPVHASCSVGYCIVDPAQVTPSQALKRADEALYAAKRAGKGRAAAWPGPRPEPARESEPAPPA
ncbi:diguanylate cyclase domain-containing protein [Luteimonas dalianensis]|uniref:diguanylate cyclase domain-containing protein n=1 Tax=Luteimonas dalianensis TaxID=1148196 RepID=UPI003BF345F1